MVTAPLFVIFLLVALGMVKWGGTHPGIIAFGVVLGLSLASTAFGGPILDGIESGMSAALSAATNLAGGAR
ncbi:hypothetical protein OH802_09770 [Nocardioides sp. NBC_00850]|uniref:hypothetical protein n=1 Tax=Nocardioides sp. NBC_00850 TaxID=2976001 RepID=UPI00386C1F0E|nr:hypothetical protein OH802_09770 [Nocardioides sp. NBC_00850]